jgi:hypothetical protein
MTIQLGRIFQFWKSVQLISEILMKMKKYSRLSYVFDIQPHLLLM